MPITWEDRLNAQIYEAYAQQFPMYRQLGQALVEQAEPLRPGVTVLDLACGTGIVTAQFASRLLTEGTVIGVDFSAAMLAIARQKLPDVTFYQARTEHIARVLPEASVDIAVCSSAFWQMQSYTQLYRQIDRKSTRLNSSHQIISYAAFCLKKKILHHRDPHPARHPARHFPLR